MLAASITDAHNALAWKVLSGFHLYSSWTGQWDPSSSILPSSPVDGLTSLGQRQISNEDRRQLLLGPNFVFHFLGPVATKIALKISLL